MKLPVASPSLSWQHHVLWASISWFLDRALSRTIPLSTSNRAFWKGININFTTPAICSEVVGFWWKIRNLQPFCGWVGLSFAKRCPWRQGTRVWGHFRHSPAVWPWESHIISYLIWPPASHTWKSNIFLVQMQLTELVNILMSQHITGKLLLSNVCRACISQRPHPSHSQGWMSVKAS